MQRLADRADFIEIDLQVLGDGAVVLWHDDQAADRPLAALDVTEFASLAGPTPGLDTVLSMLPAHVGLHLDLKFTAGQGRRHAVAGERLEVLLTRLATAALGPERVLVTSHEDDSVRVVAAWASAHAPGVRTGLSLGRGLSSVRWYEMPRLLCREFLPTRRLRSAGATAVVAHRLVAHRLVARVSAARVARRLELPLVVWTVDTPRGLRHWSRHAWLVVTNREETVPAIR